MSSAQVKTTSELLSQKDQASAWFEELRDLICAEFEAIEREFDPTSTATFQRKNWDRPTEDSSHGGGGTISMMHGKVFEKVGVNISTVEGKFDPAFASKIQGADESNGQFWATGISLVAHFCSPHIPPFHFNTRHIGTSKSWFGGGGDMNPIFDNIEDTAAFHAAWKECCDRHDPAYHAKFKQWADEYFFIKHRNEPRGIGGIFYDYIDTNNWAADFAFTQDVGRTFLDICPKIIRKNLHKTWTEEEREAQLIKRGRYVEFNLVYDRGTTFGLQTGGNPEAILMSLPPVVKWP
jgi:coproporphyrinogen III oxidase